MSYVLNVAVACATVRLNTCSLAWSAYRPRYESGSVHEVRSSEFRRVCYRINILGSQLSSSRIILVLV